METAQLLEKSQVTSDANDLWSQLVVAAVALFGKYKAEGCAWESEQDSSTIINGIFMYLRERGVEALSLDQILLLFECLIGYMGCDSYARNSI